MEVHSQLSQHGLANVFLLLDLVQTMSPTSVNNECLFSAMKLTKGRRRGRMKNSTLNDLMMINVQSSDIEEFNPDPAIKNWMVY